MTRNPRGDSSSSNPPWFMDPSYDEMNARHGFPDEGANERADTEFSLPSLEDFTFDDDDDNDDDNEDANDDDMGIEDDNSAEVRAHDDQVRNEKAHNERLQRQLRPSAPILSPHVHKNVNFTRPFAERSHSIEELTAELYFVLNLRTEGFHGNRRLTLWQRDVLKQYRDRSGHFMKLLDPYYPLTKKAVLYVHLFNVLIFQEKLTGRLEVHFSNEANEQRCADTEVDRGFATITIWSQAYITRSVRCLRQLQQILLVEMMTAFFGIYGCPRCWHDLPDWCEKGRYGIIDLQHAISAAVEDEDLIGLRKFT